MGDRYEPAVRRLRRRLYGTLMLRATLGWAAVWAFIWGAAVLGSRAAVGVDRLSLTWGAMGFVLAILLGIESARRKVPGTAAVRALIDRHAGAGGMVMAGAEVDTSAWTAPGSGGIGLRDEDGPGIQWDARRSWGVLLLAAAFVGVAFAVPARYMDLSQRSPLDITEQAERLAEQIDVLEQEQIIDEKRAEDLTAKLEQVRRDATADRAVQTWEALDQLQAQLAKMAQEAAAEAVDQTRKLSEASSLGEGVRDDAKAPTPELNDDLRDAAMRELADRVEQMVKESKAVRSAFTSSKIDPGKIAPKPAQRLRQVFLSDKVTPELRQKIREAMAELGIDPEQAGDVNDDKLKAIKDALADEKLDAAERRKLSEQLADHLREKSKLPPIDDKKLAELAAKLKELGLDAKDFALLPAKDSDRLTPEAQDRLNELADAAEPGTRYRQVYLTKQMPADVILRARLAVMRVQVEQLMDKQAADGNLPAVPAVVRDAAWKMAEDQLLRAQAGAPGAGVLDPALLDAAAQLAPDAQAKGAVEALKAIDPAIIAALLRSVIDQLPNADGFNKHIGLLDSAHVATLRRAIADQLVTDEAFADLEAALEPHKLSDNALPFDLDADQLAAIDRNLRAIGLVDEDFALMPPPDRLTPEQMEQLAQMQQAAGECKAGLAARLAKLSQMRLIDAKTLAQCQRAGQGNGQGLARFLSQNAGSMSMAQMMQSWAQGQANGQPGRGGITRGRGDAAMSWTGGSDPSGAKFKEQTLPPGAINPALSQNTGESVGAPQQVEDAGPAVASTDLQTAKAGGGSAESQTVLPRHRAAVKTYFERSNK